MSSSCERRPGTGLLDYRHMRQDLLETPLGTARFRWRFDEKAMRVSMGLPLSVCNGSNGMPRARLMSPTRVHGSWQRQDPC